MTAPIQLILVDLDNLRNDRVGPLPCPSLGPEAGDDWLDTTGPAPEPRDGNPCVVIFAMNIETADDENITFEALEALGSRLSLVLAGARQVGFEVVLTLPVKQSADKALERLLGEAPVSDHAGALSGVRTLTGDLGLRDSVGGHLGARKYVRNERDGLATSWTMVAKKGRVRRGPATRELGFIVAPEPPSDSAAAIDTAAHSAWAQTQAVQVPPQESLRQLVGLLRRRTGLLTQVGLTMTSVRGVARLSALGRGVCPTLGPCSPHDGLELCGSDLQPRVYDGPRKSSLGPGAVRFDNPCATARTMLPPDVLAAAGPSIRIGTRLTVRDCDALRNVSAAQLLRGESFKVRLSPCARGLKVQVTSGFGRPLPAWWLRGAKSFSDRIIRALRGAGSRSLTVPAVSDVLVTGRGPVLGVRAPHTGPVSAEMKEPLGEGRVGRASVRGAPIAILAREGGEQPAGPLRCRPIQELSDLDLRRAYPSFGGDFEPLRDVPLMVPI